MSTEDVVLEKKKVTDKDTKPPSKYKVIVLNDNHTPMDFVVLMFITVFKKPQEEAVQLTLKIHHEGSAIAGIYPHEIAEQKVIDGTTMARNEGFPLVLKAEVE